MAHPYPHQPPLCRGAVSWRAAGCGGGKRRHPDRRRARGSHAAVLRASTAPHCRGGWRFFPFFVGVRGCIPLDFKGKKDWCIFMEGQCHKLSPNPQKKMEQVKVTISMWSFAFRSFLGGDWNHVEHFRTKCLTNDHYHIHYILLTKVITIMYPLSSK